MSQQAHRKDEHFFIAEKLYQKKAQNGLDQIRLVGTNLPELALDEIDLQTTLVGQKIAAPFFINALTGGSTQTDKVNLTLARVAQKTNLPMAVGSQSIALKEPQRQAGFKALRTVNPKGMFLANLGVNHPLNNVNQALDMLDASAIELHLNVAQELVMPEGDRIFYWQDNLRQLLAQVKKPILVKEVGFGMTPQTLKILTDLGVKYVDLAGKGGTNFQQIENERRKENKLTILNDLGLSTAESLLAAKKYAADINLSLTASGGIRTSLDVVKCLVLGADNVGISGLFLHLLVQDGEDALVNYIETLKWEIRNIMAILGCKNISQLKKVPYLLSTELRNFVEQI